MHVQKTMLESFHDDYFHPFIQDTAPRAIAGGLTYAVLRGLTPIEIATKFALASYKAQFAVVIGTGYLASWSACKATWNYIFYKEPAPQHIMKSVGALRPDYKTSEACSSNERNLECYGELFAAGLKHSSVSLATGAFREIAKGANEFVAPIQGQIKSTTHNTIQRTKTVASSFLPNAFRADSQPGFVDLSIMNLFKQNFASLKATFDYAKNTFAVSRLDSEAHQRIIAKHSNYSGENLAIAAIGLSALAAGAYFLYNKFKAQDLPVDKIDAVSISETEKRPTSEN